MIVGARDRNDLRAGDIADRTRRDDRALAFHEAGDRGDGAECAGVGELDRAAGEVVGHQAIGARLLDDRFIRGVERGEIHRLGVLDDGHHQGAAAVFLFDVHGQAQANCTGIHPMRLAVDLLERVGHDGEALGRLDDRVSDQVGERNLLTARGQLGIQRLPAVVQRVGRDVAEGGGGWDRERLGHVGDEPGGGAGYGNRTWRSREHGARSRRCGWRWRRRRRRCSLLLAPCSLNNRELRQLAVLEELAPLLANGVRVAEPLLVHHLYEGGVMGSEDEFAHGLESIRYLM